MYKRQFPLLTPLVEQRAGGQKRLPIGKKWEEGDAPSTAPTFATLEPQEMAIDSVAQEPGAAIQTKEESPTAEPPSSPQPSTPGTVLPGTKNTRRPARYGLTIQFEDRPHDPELGRLEESTVWVNTAHPAYRRAVASRSEGYHLALSVAMSLAPLATDPKGEHKFMTAFLSRWGEVLNRAGGRKRRGG